MFRILLMKEGFCMGCCGSSGMNSEIPKKDKDNIRITEQLNPLDLLKIRLVKGELTFEEYEKIKAEIG